MMILAGPPSPCFNPRSPCGERRPTAWTGERYRLFQSTLPVWGATFLTLGARADGGSFNPRSPCGERLAQMPQARVWHMFQSTLPVRGATFHRPGRLRKAQFQSTLPVRGATCPNDYERSAGGSFNPRSPCGERLGLQRFGLCAKSFNPRSPCGERPSLFVNHAPTPPFQSTLPVRGATRRRWICV